MSFFTSAILDGDKLPNNAVAIASARIGVPRLSCNTFSTDPIKEPAIVGLAAAAFRVFAVLGVAAGLGLPEALPLPLGNPRRLRV